MKATPRPLGSIYKEETITVKVSPVKLSIEEKTATHTQTHTHIVQPYGSTSHTQCVCALVHSAFCSVNGNLIVNG